MQLARDGRTGPAEPPRPTAARRVARVAAAALPVALALAVPAWRSGFRAGRR